MKHEPTQVIAGGLLRLLADTFVLLYKLRHFCWQMSDTLSPEAMDIIRQDYRHLDDTMDDIAFNIVHLERDISRDFTDLIKMSSIKLEDSGKLEDTGNDKKALQTSLEQLIADHDQVVADIRTLEVTLPTSDRWQDHTLLQRLADSHLRCRHSLSTLIVNADDTLH